MKCQGSAVCSECRDFLESSQLFLTRSECNLIGVFLSQHAIVSLLIFTASSIAQTVRIDTASPVNTINTRDSVGAGVDRIPVDATRSAYASVFIVSKANRLLKV